jgi:hypothetical protein
MLGDATCNVSMVVLNANLYRTVQPCCVPARSVVWMKVMSNHCRLNVEEELELLDGIYERVERLIILEVADVLTQERRVILAQTESVL